MDKPNTLVYPALFRGRPTPRCPDWTTPPMIPSLSDALSARGYTSLTDVQQAVTAPELEGADLLVSARTGSGKTVGFGLAIGSDLLNGRDALEPAAAPLALIVAPTRELAMQVARELGWLYAGLGARIATCIGGMDARDERRALERGAHVVVGTPGRLRDHIARGALDLAGLRAVVLDEADEMLDLGFREDLEFILGEAPEGRRTLLFSATVPRSIVELAKSYQRDAVQVVAQEGGSQHADIAYKAVQVASADAEHAIINLLRFHDAPNAIVFANTRAAVARLAARMANRGFSVVSLSGELSQDERSHAIQALRDGRARVCVATDVAARGIDLPKLELVIHADLPSNTDTLLHRSGRTGRAGRKGISALIVPERASKKAARLLGWAKIEAEWVTAPGAEEIRAADRERLLSHEAWDGAASGEESEFAATLLERFGAEAVATACLRLYRAGLSAPEELNALPAKTEPRRDHAAFGPSFAVTLSVGRADRAEARWLLPLLIRVFDIDKTQIGKIRVGERETVVELSETVAASVRARLAQGGDLENGITARLADGGPQGAPGSKAPRSRPKHESKAKPEDRAKPAMKRAAGPGKSDRDGKASGPGQKAAPRPAPKPKAERAPGRAETKPAGGAKPGKPAQKPKAWSGADKAKPEKRGASGKGRSDTPPAKSKPAADGRNPAKTKFRPGASDPSRPMGRKGKSRAQPRGANAVPRRKP